MGQYHWRVVFEWKRGSIAVLSGFAAAALLLTPSTSWAANAQTPESDSSSTSSTSSTTTVPPTSAPKTEVGEPAPPTTLEREALVPPPIDIVALNLLLEERRADAVREANAVAEAANAEALAAVTRSQEQLAALQAQIPAADSAVTTSEAAVTAAAIELEESRNLLGDLVVESYQLAASSSDPTLSSQAGSVSDPDSYDRWVRVTTYSESAWSSVQREITDNEEQLASSEVQRETAKAARTSLEGRIGAGRASLNQNTETATNVAALGETAVEEARVLGEEVALGGLGPTIMGESIVGAEDIAAFIAARGPSSPAIDLTELATLYAIEGAAEGVRADIAVAQSIIETGNFGFRGSMVAVEDYNYAGIGACDSCSSGFNYASMQMGIRDQMQLLHAYADDNLTSDEMAFPPVRRAPEKVGVRGCCDTWMELSGVWATGPGYGVKILTIYNEMLAFAADRQQFRRLADAESVAAQEAAALAALPPASAEAAP